MMEDDWPTIPGETPIDPSGLLPKLKDSIRNRAELNVIEAENVRLAVVKYLSKRPSKRTAPFTLKWVCKLHKEMLGDVWTWAGKIRKIQLNLGPKAYLVGPRLLSLLQDLAAWETGDMPIIEQAAMLHHKTVYLHPFENGNGRWARLLGNIWLKQHDAPTIDWPEATLVGLGSDVRAEYMDALWRADELDYGNLFELHRRYSAA